jgi:hypothetical protein
MGAITTHCDPATGGFAISCLELKYTGVAQFIVDEQLNAQKVERLFSFTLRRRWSHDLRGAGNDVALVVICSAITRGVFEPESDSSAEWAIARDVSRRRPLKLFRDAHRIIENRWPEIEELVGVEQAAA